MSLDHKFNQNECELFGSIQTLFECFTFTSCQHTTGFFYCNVLNYFFAMNRWPKTDPHVLPPWYNPRFCRIRDSKLTKHFLFVSSPQTDRDLLVSFLSCAQFPNICCSLVAEKCRFQRLYKISCQCAQ